MIEITALEIAEIATGVLALLSIILGRKLGLVIKKMREAGELLVTLADALEDGKLDTKEVESIIKEVRALLEV